MKSGNLLVRSSQREAAESAELVKGPNTRKCRRRIARGREELEEI